MSIENNHWVPSIGDPTITGWVTVAVYFIVAVICFKATQTSKHNSEKSIKNLWLFLTLFLIALGINKQLDLQTLFTQISRSLAIEQGWYKDRRMIQISFILLIGLTGIVSIAFLLKTYRNSTSAIKIVLTGCVILFVFILIRASSFHHMDAFINLKLAEIKMNGLFEIAGLTIIGFGALKYLQEMRANCT